MNGDILNVQIESMREKKQYVFVSVSPKKYKKTRMRRPINTNKVYERLVIIPTPSSSKSFSLCFGNRLNI
jgi:hypothetical protein